MSNDRQHTIDTNARTGKQAGGTQDDPTTIAPPADTSKRGERRIEGKTATIDGTAHESKNATTAPSKQAEARGIVL